MRTLKNINLIYALTLTGLAILLGGNPAHAFPAFAKKENKPCAYCHIKTSGGGKRTAAGDWYKAHGLTFAGYNPGKATTGGASNKPKPVAKPKPAAKPTTKPAPRKTTPKPTVKKKG